MKKFLTMSALVLSLGAFADEVSHAHFDQASEVSCQKESTALGCGQPKSDTDTTYLSCMEKNTTKLSESCKAIIKEMKK
jgi:hypothetical protein